MKILAISGSLRAGSHNTALLRAIAEEAPEGVEVELWDGLRDIPLYDADDDLEDGPVAVEQLRDAVHSADAVLIATPEYNGSIPGGLKNALDWASRPVATNAFRNKPVGVIGASTGAFGGVWAHAELRKVLGIMGARVAEIELPVSHAHEKIAEDGGVLDDELRQGLRDALDALVETACPNTLAAV